MNKLEAIEKAYIRYAAVHSSAAKQIERWELESWLDEALTRVGRNVAAGQNFRTLQARTTAQLGYYDFPLTFEIMESFSTAGGWRSGVTIADKTLTGTIDSFIFANFAIQPNPGDESFKNNYLEFTYQSELSQPVSLALWPVSKGVDALKPTVLVEQPDILFGVTVEQNASGPNTLSAWAAGDPLLNPDLTAPVAVGSRIRINFAASGQVTVQLYEATTSVMLAEYPLVTFANQSIPFKLAQNFIPVLIFHEKDAAVSNMRVGVIDPCLAAIDQRVIVDSIRTRGSICFEDGRALGHVADGSLRGLPRVKGRWHWTDENRQIRIFPSPMSQIVYSDPGAVVWRFDAMRRAWVSIPAVPAGVTLPLVQVNTVYDPSIITLSQNTGYVINTTKEEQSVKFPTGASDGAIIRMVDSGATWATNPVTLYTSGGAVLLDMMQTDRRIVITGNRIPTIEEIPFELGEAVINALLEIALERKGQPALKQKANQMPAPISDVKPDQPNEA